MPRLLITGSRAWTDQDTLVVALFRAWEELGRPRDGVLVSGACPTGADRMAEEVWGRLWHFPIERHPADWSKGKVAGPERNQKMVNLGADLCVAFPLPDSRGTRDCADRARRAGIPVHVHHPAPAQEAVS